MSDCRPAPKERRPPNDEPQPNRGNTSTQMTKIEELKQLKEMLDQNLINQEEYDKLRSEILSPPPPMPRPLMNDIGRTRQQNRAATRRCCATQEPATR